MRTFRLSVAEIVALTQPVRQDGSTSGEITGVASIEAAQAGDLAFLENSHSIREMVDTSYEKFLSTTQASVVLVPEKFAAPAPKAGQLFLFVAKPSLAFALCCGAIERQLYARPSPGIHPTAVVDREARIHPSVHIGPLCVVGPHAEIKKGAVLHSGVIVRAHAIIGEDSELKSRVSVAEDCVIGNRCILQSGAVIGSDGFGYVFDAGRHVKVPQIGNVVIEDDVEIGANTTIDRARFGSTVIGRGSKIDNLVQIAHNVKVGRGCLMAAQVGIAGGAVLGDFVILGGQSGVAGGVTVGAQTKLAGQSGIVGSCPGGETLSGKPAMNMNAAYRLEALKRKLPELFKRVSNIEAHCGIEKNSAKSKKEDAE